VAFDYDLSSPLLVSVICKSDEEEYSSPPPKHLWRVYKKLGSTRKINPGFNPSTLSWLRNTLSGSRKTLSASSQTTKAYNASKKH
jgi:hypothetical protein